MSKQKDGQPEYRRWYSVEFRLGALGLAERVTVSQCGQCQGFRSAFYRAPPMGHRPFQGWEPAGRDARRRACR